MARNIASSAVKHQDYLRSSALPQSALAPLAGILAGKNVGTPITKTTNIAERYNQFCEWIRFASGGLMAENDPEEQQKRVRYTDIVANALMLRNVADVTDALEKLKQRGYPVQPEEVAHLSAYMTEHLQRFGEYTLKLRPVAPLSNQEKTISDPLSEQSGDAEEMSA